MTATPVVEHPEPAPWERDAGFTPHTAAERLVVEVLGGVIIERKAR